MTNDADKKQKKPKIRASVSSGSGGSNLAAMFADVSSSIKAAVANIGSSNSSQPKVENPLQTALELFSNHYSETLTVPDRLKFKKVLTEVNISIMFVSLDHAEKLLFIQDTISN